LPSGPAIERSSNAQSRTVLSPQIDNAQQSAQPPVSAMPREPRADPGTAADVTDASTTWPAGRTEIPFGAITLTARVDDQAPEQRKIIFDPLPRIEGIDSSGDPLTEVRADLYLLSGRRRRAAMGDGKH
jgi:catalase